MSELTRQVDDCSNIKHCLLSSTKDCYIKIMAHKVNKPADAS